LIPGLLLWLTVTFPEMGSILINCDQTVGPVYIILRVGSFHKSYHMILHMVGYKKENELVRLSNL